MGKPKTVIDVPEEADMRTSDLKDIPSKGFNKVWWGRHRSRKAKGTGVGTALDKWNAAKMPPGGNLANIIKGTEVKAAFDGVEALTTALRAAQTKAKGKAKETEEGIGIYLKEVTKHRRALVNAYGQKRKDFEAGRAEYLRLCKKLHKEVKANADTLKKILAESTQLERDVNAAIKDGTLGDRKKGLLKLTDQYAKAAVFTQNMAQKNSVETKRKFIWHRTPSDSGPEAMGVMKEHAGKGAKLFQTGTDLADDANAILDKIKQRTASIEDYAKEARQLIATGQRSVENSARLAQTTAEKAAKLVDKIKEIAASGKWGTTMELLDKMAKGQFPKPPESEVPKLLKEVGKGAAAIKPLAKALDQLVKKLAGRLPTDHRKHESVQSNWKGAKALLSEGLGVQEEFYEKVEKAKRDAETILSL